MIKLTEVVIELNEKGQSRLDSLNGSGSNGKDKYGFTIEQWEDLGAPIPEDSIFFGAKNDEDQEEFIILEDDEKEYIYYQILIDQTEIETVRQLDEEGSLITLKSGEKIHVKEDILTVENLCSSK